VVLYRCCQRQRHLCQHTNLRRLLARVQHKFAPLLRLQVFAAPDTPERLIMNDRYFFRNLLDRMIKGRFSLCVHLHAVAMKVSSFCAL